VNEGSLDGVEEGNRVEEKVGRLEGVTDGRLDGLWVGSRVGEKVGRLEGVTDGRLDGLRVGNRVGEKVGRLEGVTEGGFREGKRDGDGFGVAEKGTRHHTRTVRYETPVVQGSRE